MVVACQIAVKRHASSVWEEKGPWKMLRIFPIDE